MRIRFTALCAVIFIELIIHGTAMISICLTNFNRFELLFDSFKGVLNDDRVSEVIISDDCSDYDLYKKIVDHAAKLSDKIKVSRTDTNIDCYRNKRRAVSLASSYWVIVLDSDNKIGVDYLDALDLNHSTRGWDKRTILQPEFAKPEFDFKKFSGRLINRLNIKSFIQDGRFQTMLNAMNYFVHRDEYLRVWDGSVDPVTSDSIFQNYNWLKAGNSIYVVPGLEYEHKVNDHQEEGSHYRQNYGRTKKGFHESIVRKLKALR